MAFAGFGEGEYTSIGPNSSTRFGSRGATPARWQIAAAALYATGVSRNPIHSPLRAFAALAAVAWLALVAATPAAATRPSQAERWKGRFCTSTGCAGAPSSPWGMAAGFGTVVLAAGWIARRPRTHSD
jgi:hypothetical protein